jgi:tetratricopeptide (TPR) repeat protein
MRSESSRPAVLVAKALLLSTIVISPELLGGVHAWATCIICGMSLATLLAVLWATWRSYYKVSISGLWVALAMTIALVWTAIQAIPFPCSFVGFVAPKSVEQLRLTLSTIKQTGPAWCFLSRDPGNTEIEIIKGIAIVAVFCAAWLFMASRNHTFIATCVAWSTITMAVVTLGHRLLLADRVFGMYTPLWAPIVYGPILNPNSLAGFLVMGLPVIVAFGINAERSKRIFWYALALLVGAVVILTLSRSGIAALVCSSLLFGVLIVARRIGRGRVKSILVFAGISFASGICLGAYAILNEFLTEVSNHDLSKFDLVAKALKWSSKEALWLGVGRGAFSVSFVEYLGSRVRFTHPENILVQWISEWGLPVAALLFLLLSVMVVRRLLQTHSLTTMAALVGIITIVIQNLLDFGLELSGVAVVAAALLAVGLTPGYHRSHERHHKKPENRFIPAFPVRNLACVVLSIGIVAIYPLSIRAMDLDKRTLERHFRDAAQAKNRKLFKELLVRALSAHPSEPNFTLLAGAEAVYFDDPTALKLLNRTMQLAPNWSQPHVFAAQWLFNRGFRLQALLEIREAEIRIPNSATGILCRVLSKERDATLLLRAAPIGVERARFLEMATGCVDCYSELCKSIDRELLTLNPGLLNPQIREARRLFRSGNADQAEAKLRSVIQKFPDSPDAYFVLAEMLLGSGKPKPAIAVLQSVEKYIQDKKALLLMRAQAYANLGDERSMRLTVERLRDLTSSDMSSLASTLGFLGQLELQLGNRGHALKAFEESNRISPTTQALASVASICEQLGELRRAYHAYARLCELEPANTGYCDAVERLIKHKVEE